MLGVLRKGAHPIVIAQESLLGRAARGSEYMTPRRRMEEARPIAADKLRRQHLLPAETRSLPAPEIRAGRS